MQLQKVSQAKFEEHMAREIKRENKHFLTYIRGRKTTKEAVGQIRQRWVKGLLKKDSALQPNINFNLFIYLGLHKQS